MPIISVRIPQIGEGLQEARLVAVLKQPGDSIKRDEPIYQMETDKAVMDVESPYEGKLVEWLAAVDAILPIGGEVGRMEVADGVGEIGGGHAPAPAPQAQEAAPVPVAAAGARNANIPPRTRAYAKEKGVSDEVLAGIPSASGKLMPADVDAYLSGSGGGKKGEGYAETAVSPKQRLLASRLVRGSQLVVPGTIVVQAGWEPIENLRARAKARGGENQPSAFTMFAFCVARALAEHPAFRSTLVNDETLRTYDHADLGIAVARPGDELLLAVVEDSDTLAWSDFAARMRERIELARDGHDQANEATTISLTNMQSFGLRDAVPVVVPPGVATLFLGEPYWGLDQESSTPKRRRFVNLSLTFDHRVLNGVGAANFLNAVKENLHSVGGLIDL